MTPANAGRDVFLRHTQTRRGATARSMGRVDLILVRGCRPRVSNLEGKLVSLESTGSFQGRGRQSTAFGSPLVHQPWLLWGLLTNFLCLGVQVTEAALRFNEGEVSSKVRRRWGGTKRDGRIPPPCIEKWLQTYSSSDLV